MIESIDGNSAGSNGGAHGRYLPVGGSVGSSGGMPEAAEIELAAFKLGMRRFKKDFARLPFDTQATCPGCGRVVPATFAATAGGVAVTFHCSACGRPREFHHDAIYTAVASDRPGSPARTLCGSAIRPILRGLPRTVETLCPECLAIIVGRYFVQDGAVWIEKTCPRHGYFRDCVNSDARLYAKAAWWSFEEHPGQQHPHVAKAADCPSDCGLCNQHQSSACLAQIDLTNRCNMHCPICFANAGAAGYVYQPGFEQVVGMLQALRDLRPIPATAIQFTGGEPTLHPDFLPHRRGGAGDGLLAHPDRHQRPDAWPTWASPGAASRPGCTRCTSSSTASARRPTARRATMPGIWAKKLACVENCRRTGMKICLVPTIIHGRQRRPGRARSSSSPWTTSTSSARSATSRSASPGGSTPTTARPSVTPWATWPHDIARQTGCQPLRDMFPLSVVVPLAQILQALTGQPKIRPSCHPDCAFGTYFLVSPDGKAYPFPQVVDIEGMFTEMNRIAARIERRGRAGWLDRVPRCCGCSGGTSAPSPPRRA